MAKFTYHERFTNVKKYDDFSNSYIGIKIASKLNQKNGENYKLLDVTDLDWQGAWLATAGAYINDTYELLDAIDNIADLAELEWVKNKINDLDENVTNIINVLPSYVTKDEFDLIISQQQKALVPGAYITIDAETNVISTYDLLSIKDAENIYSTKDELYELSNYLDENFYDKYYTEYLVNNTAYSYIQKYVVKGADVRYNDLEKISNWILTQSNFIPIDYTDINTNSDEKYFIYDESSGKYIEVDKEYIETHTDAQYYIEEQVVDDLIKLNNRINRLDDAVGYIIYYPEYDTYSYTNGLLSDVNALFGETEMIEHRLDDAENNAFIAYSRANESYNISVVSYGMAYFAYEMSLLSDAYAYAAYVMAYDSQIKIGNESVDGYYRPINEEELEKLKENQFSIDVYSKTNQDDIYYKHETYFDLDKYENGELYYYVYVEPIKSTGFYKTLEDYNYAIQTAQHTAENALFGLNANTIGTTYAYLDLKPDINDGTNSRTIILNVNEADVKIEDGKILNNGFITTYSLYNSFAYTSTIYKIFGLYDDINGLIKIDDNDIVYIYNNEGVIEHTGKSILNDKTLILYEYDTNTGTLTNNIIYRKEL